MDAILGFEPIGIIAGIVRNPHFIWGYTKEGVKVCKKLPTIPDKNYPEPIGMSTDDKLVVRESIEDVMTEFDRLGFTMPEEDIWDFPERTVRIFMKDSNYVDLVANPLYRGLIYYYDLNVDFVITRNGGRWLYLERLRDEHRFILGKFNAIIDG